MTSAFDDFLHKKLMHQTEAGLKRELKTGFDSLIDFASNDYLGLSRSEELHHEILLKISKFVKNGSTGSRLLTGNSEYAELVEFELSKIFKAEAALIFNSGYTANLSVLSSIPQRGDTIIFDELAHTSIKDGARLSLANRFSFRHNDLEDLEHKIKKSKGKIFIAIESIYSMDGDEAPLKEIVDIAESYNAAIILDEAHSTGVVGDGGSGIAVSRNLQDKIAVRVYTFGKALGLHGACAVGSKRVKEYLINFARPFIYTTAPGPHSLISIRCAFDFLKKNPARQAELSENVEQYLAGVNTIASRTKSRSAIQTMIVPGNKEAKQLASVLQLNGFDIRPILSPTVPKGAERLRICIHNFNSKQEIKSLTELLVKKMKNP